MPTPDSQIRAVNMPPAQLRDLLDHLEEASKTPEVNERRSRRLKYRSVNVLVHVLDKGQQRVTSFTVPTRNISVSGLAFLHKQMLSPGQMLKLEIPLLDDQVLRMLARVVHCRHVKGMVHEIGTEFLKLADHRS